MPVLVHLAFVILSLSPILESLVKFLRFIKIAVNVFEHYRKTLESFL